MNYINFAGCYLGERRKNSLGGVVEIVGFYGGYGIPWLDYKVYYERVTDFGILSGNAVGLHPDIFFKNYKTKVGP